jgi:hypothetical protein
MLHCFPAKAGTRALGLRRPAPAVAGKHNAKGF